MYRKWKHFRFLLKVPRWVCEVKVGSHLAVVLCKKKVDSRNNPMGAKGD